MISERDNVATALEPLEPGRTLDARRGARSRCASAIPPGHKVALRADSRRAKPVIKYGSPIGLATGGHRGRRARAHAQRGQQPRPRRSRARGQRAAAAGRSHRTAADRTTANRRHRVDQQADVTMTPRFPRLPPARRPRRHAQSRAGRADGDLLVRRRASALPASPPPVGAALPHLAGCGQLGPDMRVTHDTLAAYCAHPNVGAVLVVALGCEQVVAQHLAEAARRHGKPAEIVAIQSEGGTVRTTEKGSRIAQALAGALATQEREWCDASELVLSLKCGGSDYTSGLASNPTLGRVTDRLVDLGGSAVLGEIAEIMGAEHLLASRATHAGGGDAS